MSEFIAFIIGVLVGVIIGVLTMAFFIGAKKSRGGIFLPEDD